MWTNGNIDLKWHLKFIHRTKKTTSLICINSSVYRRGFWGSTQQIESNNDITDLTELNEILDIGLYIKIQ